MATTWNGPGYPARRAHQPSTTCTAPAHHAFAAARLPAGEAQIVVAYIFSLVADRAGRHRSRPVGESCSVPATAASAALIVDLGASGATQVAVPLHLVG